MLRQALSFPVSGKEGGKTFVFGGLAVFGLLVGLTFGYGAVEEIADALVAGRSVEQVYYAIAVVGLLVGAFCYLLLTGFAARVLAAAARGQDVVPAFGSVSGLLGAGGRVMGVKAGYLAPGLGLSLLSRILADAPLSGLARTVSRSAAALALLAFILYMVTLFYVVPAAVTMFALEGNARAAFDLGRLRETVISEDYAVGWTVGVVLLGVGGLISTLLMALLVGFFAFFHVNAAARYCYGTGVGRALGLRDDGGGQEPKPTTESPADPMAREFNR